MFIKNNVLNLNKILINVGTAFLLYTLVSSSVLALTYELPEGNVVGSYKKLRAREGESLLSIAMQYDVGMHEIMRANPHLQRYRYLRSGTEVIIPAQFVLPSGPRQGIVLNLGDMRVFYYHGNRVSTYPVGIGRQGWSTPLGHTLIVSKETNPTWHPTASIRREAARKGKRLPLAYPPGPRNPLGHYAMHLGFRGILMHGTNAPSSIGLRSSHGCIRLFPNDIAELYSMTAIGTPVRVVNEPHH